MPVVRADLRYVATCTALGIALGWIPSFLHGPIAAKFAVLHRKPFLATAVF